MDVKATNKKLAARAICIVMQIIDCKENIAKRALDKTDYDVKLSILMLV